MTGVRWDESVSRKNNRNALEVISADRKKSKLFNDNDDNRRQFENCMQKGKRVINPIIDWTTEDVWRFLKTEGLPYCKLYDEGFHRIGCLGCPMGNAKGQERDFQRYPLVKKKYIKAFELMIENRKVKGLPTTWKTGEEVMEWWLYATDKEQQQIVDGQMEWWDEDEEF